MRYRAMLAPFFAKQWHIYLFGVLVLIAVDLLQIVIPRIIGRTVDSFVQKLPFMQYIVQVVLIAFLIAILRFVYRECIMGTTRRLEYFLRERLFTHALRIPLHIYDKQGPGSVMALTTNDVMAIRVAVGFGMLLFVDAVIMGLATFVMMVKTVHWQLAVWAVLPLLPILLGATLMGKSVHNRFRGVQETFSQLTEFAQEALSGVKVIKSFTMENVWIERFAVISGGNVEANLTLARLQAAYVPATHILPLFSYAITLFVGGRLIIEGALSLGDLTAFIGYLGLILWPLMGVGFLINTLQRGSASLKRIGEFLDTPVYDTDGSQKVFHLKVPITINHLTFYYPETTEPALKDISLTIPYGAKVGIVGRPGSGKSTLLKLLLRLYDTPRESIWLGQHEIHELPFADLRRHMGYVPQESSLFSRTIADNISFGNNFNRKEIAAAAKLAAIDEDIDTRPEGYGTLLGEKGKRLSGGQQQRVAVARGLLHRPDIMLLDDVFSALDYRTQARLLANLDSYLTGRTAIIVSQRIAAVKGADIIFVMDQGQIVEQGTHDQLVQQNGLYSKLYEQQLVSGEA